MSESKAVDLPSKATPLAPGEPVEAPALSAMGATFAERAAAAAEKDGKAVTQEAAEDKSVSSPRESKGRRNSKS